MACDALRELMYSDCRHLCPTKLNIPVEYQLSSFLELQCRSAMAFLPSYSIPGDARWKNHGMVQRDPILYLCNKEATERRVDWSVAAERSSLGGEETGFVKLICLCERLKTIWCQTWRWHQRPLQLLTAVSWAETAVNISFLGQETSVSLILI